MMTRDPVCGGAIERRSRSGAALARWVFLAALACVMVVTVGCATSPPVSGALTPTAALSPAATIGPTATPVPTLVAIADLGTFRQKFAAAFTSGKWSSVQPLLSLNFSFQPPFQTAQKTGSSHLFPPDSLTNLKTSLAAGSPWTLGSDYDLSLHTCYAGNTPLSQVIGFDGSSTAQNGYDSHYLMFGIERWQGYWVVAWGFDDSGDQQWWSGGYCIGAGTG